jgi:hypothetical protein
VTKRLKFARIDAPWIEEITWIYQHHGFFENVRSADPKLVDKIVKAFEKRYGRPPKWNTPYENERLLALDTDRTSTLPLLDMDRQPPLKGLYATAVAEWARIAGIKATKIREVPDPKKGKVRVELVVGGKKHELAAKLYRHGQFDLTILRAMNKLMPKGRALYVVRTDGHAPMPLIVPLGPKAPRDLQVSFGLHVWGPDDWKKMAQVFADREASWAEEEDEDDYDDE